MAVGVVAIVASPARAERTLSAFSYWNGPRTLIYTDSLVANDDGTVTLKHRLGGSVDGIAMIQIAHLASGAVLPYVRSVSKTSEVPLYWDRTCVFMTPDGNGTTHLAGDAEQAPIAAAMANWNDNVSDCSYIHLSLLPPKKGLSVKRDSINAVTFVEKDWCQLHSNADGCEDVTALTTIFHIDKVGAPNEGEIIETDIEINGEYFAIGICSSSSGSCVTESSKTFVQDLENTLTHEVGHALGLSHTCWLSQEEASLLDENGELIPRCGTAAASTDKITQATMFPSQATRETKKRSVEADDIAGICAIYPKARDPKYCEPDDGGGGCAVAPVGGARDDDDGGNSGGALTCLLLGGLAVSAFRQRRAGAASSRRRRG